MVHQALVPGGFNAVINGFFAWLLFRNKLDVLRPEIIQDASITLFLIYALTCIIVSPIIARGVAKDAAMRTDKRRHHHPLLKLFPHNLLLRGVVFGLIGLCVWVPLMWFGFQMLDLHLLSAQSFIIFKIVYTGVTAALITPVIAWCAICDANERLAAA